MDDLRNMPTARLVGLTALAFSAVYRLSDFIEAIQGGFPDGQLSLTLVAEAAVPVFVLGLYSGEPRPRRRFRARRRSLEQPPGDIEALLAELLLGGQALSEWAVKSRIRCDQQSWRFLGSKPR